MQFQRPFFTTESVIPVVHNGNNLYKLHVIIYAAKLIDDANNKSLIDGLYIDALIVIFCYVIVFS